LLAIRPINEPLRGRDDHRAGMSKWTPAGVCILRRSGSGSSSQYFRFALEESTRDEHGSGLNRTGSGLKPILD